MRDIRAGEELTHDWAMTDDDDYSVECNCGASNCRKTLTGKDCSDQSCKRSTPDISRPIWRQKFPIILAQRERN